VIVGDTPRALGDDELAAVAATVDTWAARQLDELDVVDAVERDTSDGQRWFLRVRGEAKDVFTIWLELRQRTLRFETYVLPSPPASREAIFERVLELNHELYGVAFTIGEEDAVFLRGHIPADSVSDAELDRILGTLYALTERHFGWLVELAFRRGSPGGS